MYILYILLYTIHITYYYTNILYTLRSTIYYTYIHIYIYTLHYTYIIYIDTMHIYYIQYIYNIHTTIYYTYIYILYLSRSLSVCRSLALSPSVSMSLSIPLSLSLYANVPRSSSECKSNQLICIRLTVKFPQIIAASRSLTSESRNTGDTHHFLSPPSFNQAGP